MKSFKWIFVKQTILICTVVGIMSFVISSLFFHEFSLEMFMASLSAEVVEIFLIVLLLSMALGAVMGVLNSGRVSKPFRRLNQSLSEVEGGNHTFDHEIFDQNFKEFQTLTQLVTKLANKSEEQSLLIQQKTNEYAQEKENIFEEAIAVERGRLARELHDSVSQQLFAISMMSSALAAGMGEDGPFKEQISKLEYMSVQAQSEMRALLMHLRPVQLEGKKLAVGIHELLTELSAKQNLDVRWQLDDLTFERGVEDHLFRILQEAISNTLRHAKASKLEISLKRANHLAIMRIFDNGVGFNKDDRAVGSYGLETMKERASEIGGALKIMSLKDTGTQIEIKIPVQKAGEDHEKN